MGELTPSRTLFSLSVELIPGCFLAVRGRTRSLGEAVPSGWGWPDLALGGMAADRPETAVHLEGTATLGTARRVPRNSLFSRTVAQGKTRLATIFSTFLATSTETS